MSERQTPSGWGRFLVVYWQVVLGAVLITSGFAGIFLAWWGVSGNPVVSVQLTYLASGGVGGMALVVLGTGLLVVFQLSRRNALLAHLAETARPGPEDDTAEIETGVVLVPEGAKTYHRPDCIYVDGKSTRAHQLDAEELDGLKPCGVCDPA